MMRHGEQIIVAPAGLPSRIDCGPEHVGYCLHLTARIEPRAATILAAAPDITRTELLFLVALSLADEVYGTAVWRTAERPPDPGRWLEDGENVSPEQLALTSLLSQLCG